MLRIWKLYFISTDDVKEKPWSSLVYLLFLTLKSLYLQFRQVNSTENTDLEILYGLACGIERRDTKDFDEVLYKYFPIYFSQITVPFAKMYN